jgi:uncharacterized membrane protein YfcA
VLLVPALTQLFGMDLRRAAGLTLWALVAPVTLPGAWKYYTQGHVKPEDLQIAALLAVVFGIGTYMGAQLQNYLSLSSLRLIFGLLLLYVASRTLIYSNSETVYAVAGLSAVLLGWLSWLSLRAIGRKHLARPDLGNEIRRSSATPSGPDDYYI